MNCRKLFFMNTCKGAGLNSLSYYSVNLIHPFHRRETEGSRFMSRINVVNTVPCLTQRKKYHEIFSHIYFRYIFSTKKKSRKVCWDIINYQERLHIFFIYTTYTNLVTACIDINNLWIRCYSQYGSSEFRRSYVPLWVLLRKWCMKDVCLR